MSTNRLMNILDWRVVATVSTPDADYVKIYPKVDGYWYTVDSSGSEKQLSISKNFKNGLVSTPLVGSSDFQIDVSLGTGLTFSADVAGSTINVFGLTAYSFNTTNSYTSGYLLSATSGGLFEWIAPNNLSLSGTTNSISKFTGLNSIGNSLMSDNGTIVYIGTQPSFVAASFSVGTNVNIGGYLYLNDNLNNYIVYNSGVLINTNTLFRVNNSSTNLISLNSSTASILNLFEIGNTPNNYVVASNISNFTIGSSSISSTVSIYSNTQGALRIKDGTEGSNKFFVSDSNGVGTWQYPYGYNGLTTSGIGFGINSGYGLTVSNGALIFNNLIIGNGLTVSTVGTVSLPLTGVVSGTYGSTNSTPIITVDSFGRITNISATATSGSGGSANVYMTPYDKNWTALSVSYGTASLSTLSRTPIPGSYVAVYVNGQEMQVGNATTSAPCWFGTQSNSPKGFSSSNAISSGDYLYWNATQSGYNLEAGFKIAVHYLTTTL